MRDILIMLIYIPAILYGLKKPYIALLVYYWISFMNPHRFTWGFAYSLPLAMVASLVTMASCFMHYKELVFPSIKEVWFLFLLWLFFTITTIFAFYPENAWAFWDTTTKIFFMTFFIIFIVNDKNKIIYFVTAIVAFIGFVGVKGAVFGIMTAGQYKVWGPPESFLADNNGLGLALVMTAPLGFFIRDLFNNKWISRALLVTSVSMIIAAILTYSRGALVGLLAMGFFLFLKRKNKIVYILVMIIVIPAAITVMPSSWMERMGTIQDFEHDKSANMRLNSWQMSFNIASKNFLGAGFDCWTEDIYWDYAPDPELGILSPGVGSTAHSIYFEVLATQGFIGLIIYLACLFSMIIGLRGVENLCKQFPELNWAEQISKALFVSTIGFMVSGAFLSLAFFDLFWALYAVAICLKFYVIREVQNIQYKTAENTNNGQVVVKNPVLS